MNIDLFTSVVRLRVCAQILYFALRIQQLHSSAGPCMSYSVVLAFLVVTHVVKGCAWRRRGCRRI